MALGGSAAFVAMDRNPVVMLLARTGISPSPLERLFGLKGFFSGMTEGMHRLTNGNLSGAIDANPYTLLIASIFPSALFLEFDQGYEQKLTSEFFLSS